MTPDGNQTFTLNQLVKNKTGESIEDAKGSSHEVTISLDSDLDLSFGNIMHYLNESGSTRQPFAQK